MYKLTFLTIMLFLANFLVGQNTANLTVSISNIELNGGKILVGVYDSESSFKKKAGAVDSLIIFPTSETTIVLFNNIPIGDYAIAVFHDINNNGKLDTGKLKIPTEPVGISNYSLSNLKLRPTFKKAKFILCGDTLVFIPLTQNNQ